MRNPKWGNTVALFDDYRDQLFTAQKIVDGRGMLCNFLENHDKTRIIDRFLMPEDQNRYSEKMLPVTNFFLPGIVFLYQGQEIGMRDDPKQSIQGFVDKPTFAIYDRLIAEGKRMRKRSSRSTARAASTAELRCSGMHLPRRDSQQVRRGSR